MTVLRRAAACLVLLASCVDAPPPNFGGTATTASPTDPDPATSTVPDGCCEPYCDLTEPNTCPGQGQQCLAWYAEGTAPPECEHLGVCSLPG